MYDSKGQVIYEEQHLAITAKKIMEKKNLKLPKHLQKIIEEVGGATSQSITQSQIANPQTQTGKGGKRNVTETMQP